jgi:hypothetical protein
MHSPESVYDDLEGDRRSREGEIRLVERLIEGTQSEDERAMLKRSLVLLAYAHLEGFCKFSLLAYAAALNALKIRCVEASYPVAAAGLSKVFAALRNPNSKHDAFRHIFPDDAQLHLLAREQVFVSSYEKIVSGQVEIPDQLIDTKSNLSAGILRKMLFQLGLSYPVVDEHEANISKLLGIRNAIAHGDRLKVPGDKDIDDYVVTALSVMKFLQNEVYAALKGQVYLRKTDDERSVPISEGKADILAG